MVRVIPVDDPLADEDPVAEEMIRTSPSVDDKLLMPLHRLDALDPHFNPDIFRLDESLSDDEFPSIVQSGPPLMPLLSDEDDYSTPSPTGVDCPQRALYPFYDQHGRILLVPKSYIFSDHVGHPESPDISLVDLISEISEDEAAELNDDNLSETQDSIQQPELNDPSPPTYSRRVLDGGAEESKEDEDDHDGVDQDHSLALKFELAPSNSILELPLTEPVQPSKNPFENFTIDWLLSCFSCGDFK